MNIMTAANYNLVKIENTNNLVNIVFTDEEIVATFKTPKAASLYCLIQNGYHQDTLFFEDQITVMEFNKSL